MKMSLFDELFSKVRKASLELQSNGLKKFGYEVLIELSINSYRQLLLDRDNYFAVRTEVDDPKDCVCKGTIYGVKFIVTKDIDRVLVAKEF
jgi:hypothetical protein